MKGPPSAQGDRRQAASGRQRAAGFSREILIPSRGTVLTFRGARPMTVHATTFLLGLLLAGGGETTKNDLKALQGTWRTIAVELNGKRIEQDLSKDRLTIRDNRFEMVAGKETMIGTLTLDASKDPRTIDTLISAGAHKGLKS